MLSADKKIMVAMSGGVDSTVAAKLLTDAGYSVHCVYFVMSDAHLKGVNAAKTVSEQLGLPFQSMDMRKEFGAVIRYFCEEYCDGRTPNPCVLCNPTVKFKALCDAADRENCEYIATGHYARVERKNGFSVLRKAVSVARDQSYMLYSLSQEQLSRLILPLGELEKPDVRKIAESNRLASAASPDSQEICFIPDNDYPRYINALGYIGKQGNFISPDGKIAGAHKGVEHYTVGQRKGLNLSFGKPVFIKSIAENGDILLGYSGDEFSSGVEIRDLKPNGAYPISSGDILSVKLRSMARPAACKVDSLDIEKARLRLVFSTPQRAPAPGQAAVFYDGEYLVGGGIIERCF